MKETIEKMNKMDEFEKMGHILKNGQNWKWKMGEKREKLNFVDNLKKWI